MIQDAIVFNSLLTGLVVLILVRLDRFEREPLSKLCLLLLVTATVTTLFGEGKLALLQGERIPGVLGNFVEAGFFEEALKFLIFGAVLATWKSIDEEFDLLLYMGYVASGLALAENVHYYLVFTSDAARESFRTLRPEIYNEAFSRILVARLYPGHVVFDLVGCGFLVYGWRKWHRVFWFMVSFGVAIALHGTWNQLAETGGPILAYAFVLSILAAFVVFWSLRRSPFRARQAALASSLDRHVATTRSSDLRIALNTARRRIGRMVFLRGDEQSEVAGRLEMAFAAAGSGDTGAARVHLEAASGLLPEPASASGWTYWIGVAILLMLTCGVAALVALLL